MNATAIILGILLLVLGRTLFWLFVGAVGFAAGIEAARILLEGSPEWVFLAAGLLTGLVGALLAVFLQRLTILLSGFLAGWYAAAGILLLLKTERGDWMWMATAAGGILGAILLSLFFDWALIILSSLAGAALVTQAAPALRPGYLSGIAIFVLLFAAGLGLQSWMKLRERKAGS